MIIYADMILVVNVLMNSIILFFTALLTGSAIKIWRIIIAAGIGSIYVLASIIDKTYFLSSVGAKLAISIVLVYTVFGFMSLGTFLLRLGTFYVTSFIFGGAVLGWFVYCIIKRDKVANKNPHYCKDKILTIAKGHCQQF